MTAATNAVLGRLYALASRGAVLGLDRVRAAAERLGNPERRFSSVHIAGTNGKGSVAAMVAAMARCDGAKVGLYTSPHLCRFNERIQIDGQPAGPELLFPALEQVLDLCPDLTFFETATLTAFLIFARTGVELAVVEVGLGGRLDATNVLDAPRATAITRISLDHIDRLGSDVASIAREKAGIVKAGVPVVVGPLLPGALREVMAKAAAMKARVEATAGNAELSAFVERHPPALAGEHQRENARIAVALAREVGLSDRANGRGLAEVEWHGRLETLHTEEGDVLLDAAHNADGARALAVALAGRRLAAASVALVFGAMADKDYRAMLGELAPWAEQRIYVAPEGRRAADPEALAQLFPGQVASGAAEAIRIGRRAVGRDGLLLVTGSIFLVGAVRALLLDLPRDPAVAL